MPQTAPLTALIQSARLIVCAGPGGVGKTTSAAALGLRAARAGRRVIVLTIDPAKRLANSLGLQSLSNEPQRIDLPAGTEGEGQLWAMMLDQKKTLDDLVARFAPDKGALARAQANNIYRLMSSALHGMQEYMALDKLHDLYTDTGFDLVVLDTPPTKNALEFLDTPSRAKSFFDERVIKWFLPSRRTGVLGRVFDSGAVVLKLLGKVLGEEFVRDLSEFFETLEFLQQALHSRGEMIDYIMRDEQTHFCIVCSADPRRISEALFFHQKLQEIGKSADAFVINRVVPSYVFSDLESLGPEQLAPALPQYQASELAKLWRELADTYSKLAALAQRDRSAIAKLAEHVGHHKLQRVPMLGKDVHSLDQLIYLGTFLAPE